MSLAYTWYKLYLLILPYTLYIYIIYAHCLCYTHLCLPIPISIYIFVSGHNLHHTLRFLLGHIPWYIFSLKTTLCISYIVPSTPFFYSCLGLYIPSTSSVYLGSSTLQDTATTHACHLHARMAPWLDSYAGLRYASAITQYPMKRQCTPKHHDVDGPTNHPGSQPIHNPC
ncbi:hypothetical protein BDW74DRAFT_156043 [Aspergillus multicolor]|uniref:uncharacterized protein n=1 Tax=Aspergillus multicolor TaxID=41759 RepID=UPI003CCE4879